jgi:hypothetical protein
MRRVIRPHWSGLRVVSSLLLLLSATGLAFGAASKPAPALLTYHQGEGDRAIYTTTVNNTMKFLMNTGQPLKGTSISHMRVEARFLGLTPDNTIQVQGRVLSGSAKETLKGESHEVTLRRPLLTNYEITRQGEVKIEAKAYDQEAEEQTLGISFGAGDTFLGMQVAVLPKKPVKVGDAWGGTVVMNASEGGDEFPIKYNSKALGQAQYCGKPCWRIKTSFRLVKVESEQAPDGTELQVKLTITGDLIWLFNQKDGLLMTADGTAKATADAQADLIAEGLITGNGTWAFDFHTKLIEYNGEKVAAK